MDESGDERGRILIIRFSAMGDIILTSGLIRQLVNRFPDRKIDFLVKTEYASLLEHNPHLSQVLTFDSCAKGELWRMLNRIRHRYEFLVDLQSGLRSFLLRTGSGGSRQAVFRHKRLKRFFLVRMGIDFYGETLPVPMRFLQAVKKWDVCDDNGGLEFYLDKKARAQIEERIIREMDPEKRIIALAPGAGRETKKWPQDRFAAVGDYFREQGFEVVLVGGEGDRSCCAGVEREASNPLTNWCGTTSLQQTGALISMADCLICNDTGVMHLATALQVPVTALFGPTAGRFGFMPFRARAAVVERNLSCRPCSRHGSERCPKGHFKCMNDIEAAEVINTAEHLMKRGGHE